MTELWIPSAFASARECLRPIINNEQAFHHLMQPFDPQKTLFSTAHFSSSLLHYRGGTENDMLFCHNVFLPLSFDQDAGLAYMLNCGRQAVRTNKSLDPSSISESVSRTTVICFKYSTGIGFDATHYQDNTVAIMCAFDDMYGAPNIYSFLFRKNDQGEIDLDHPLQSMYSRGKPYCRYCHYLKQTCTCSDQELESTKILVNIKPLSSFANFITWFTNRRATSSKVYVANKSGTISFLENGQAYPRQVTRVSGWDYVGPHFLVGVMPLEANLISDSFNPFLNVFRLEEDENFRIGSWNWEQSSFLSNSKNDSGKRRTGSIPVSMLIEPYHDQYPVCEWEETGCMVFPSSFTKEDEEMVQVTLSMESEVEELTTTQNSSIVSSQSVVNNILSTQNGRLLSPQIEINYPRLPQCVRTVAGEVQANNIPLSQNIRITSRGTGGRPVSNEAHLSLRAFECNQCGKVLSSKRNLGKHVRLVHEKVKKYECDICGWKTHQSFNLRRHRKVVHNVDTGERE